MKEGLHLVWSTECPPGECPHCGAETALLIGSGFFECDCESSHAEVLADGVETGLEITCHWCQSCGAVTAIAINGGA